MTVPVVLLSVRSPHIERLLAGAKTVEFRRRQWRVPDGSTVLLYRSGSNRGIVGSFIVESTAAGAPSTIWKKFGDRSCLSRREYRAYFDGAITAIAIEVGQVRKLDAPLGLGELRRRSPEFHVPQSYRFMKPDELGVVLNGERKVLFESTP